MRTMAASETNEASSLSRVGAGKAATRNCQASFERSLSRMLNYMSVEPLVLCYLVPAMLFATVLSNLELEKSCRADLAFNDVVCTNMMDKSLHQIDCADIKRKLKNENEIHLYLDPSQVLNDTHYKNELSISREGRNKTILFNVSKLELDVCHAEVESQMLNTKLHAFCEPFYWVFSTVIMLFADTWSDKRRKRKPCLILPMIGGLASSIVLLAGVIFLEQFPLEFSMFFSTLATSIFGAGPLMITAIFSYLSETTPAADRVCRFNFCTQTIVLILIFFPMADLFFSSFFSSFGYFKIVLLCITINVVGLSYGIFILKEIEPKANEAEKIEIEESIDKVTGDTTEQVRETQNVHRPTATLPKNKKHLLVDFFNAIAGIECVRVIFRKRKNQTRAVILLLILIHFIAIGPANAEHSVEANYVRIKFGWDASTFKSFTFYSSVLCAIFDLIMTHVLSKVFKASDPMVAIIEISISAVSKIIYMLATSTWLLYVGRVSESFSMIRALVVRSLLSNLVDPVELGRSFSILGIMDGISIPLFGFVYSKITKQAFETWPGAFYVASLIALILTIILFTIVYVMLRHKVTDELRQKTNLDAINVVKPLPVTEIHM